MILATEIIIALAAAAGILHLAKGSRSALKAAQLLAVLAVLIQLGWLFEQSRAFRQCPMVEPWGVMAVVAIALIAIAGRVSLRYKFPAALTGVLLLLFIAFILGEVFFPPPGRSPVRISWMLGFHILAAAIGFSVLALGCVSGILILIRSRNLKSVRWSAESNAMWPSLTELDKIFFRTVGLGILLLSLGIILGAVLVPEAHLKGSWYLDPKAILSAAGWLLYGWVWVMRKRRGFSSRPIVAAATIGYILVLLGFFLSGYIATGFHRF